MIPLRCYAATLRMALVSRSGAVAFVVASAAYVVLFLWLGGMLLYNSGLNYHDIPLVNYDLTPGVGQPDLIFVPNPDVLLFVNVTAAVSVSVLGGLFGLGAALFLFGARQIRMAARSRRGGAGLTFAALPTLVPYLGLGCCGTPALPLLVGLLPGPAAGFALRLGLHYELIVGASAALLAASAVFSLEGIRRAGVCAPAVPRLDGPGFTKGF